MTTANDASDIRQGILDAECIVGAATYHHPDTVEMAKLAIKLHRALSAPPPAVAPQGWQPIETAPKNNTDVLVSYHGLVRIAFWDTARGGQWSLWPGREKVQPTKWMLLPTAPEKSNG